MTFLAVTVSLSDSTFAALEKAAEKLQIPVSDIASDLIRSGADSLAMPGELEELQHE